MSTKQPPELSHGLIHVFKAFTYSMAGLRYALKSSSAFRQEGLVLLALCAVLWLTGKEAGTWALCLAGWLTVMAAELINSALEEAFNLITMEYSEGVKAGKDMGSAAVFVLMCANGLIWMYFFGSDLLALVTGL